MSSTQIEALDFEELYKELALYIRLERNNVTEGIEKTLRGEVVPFDEQACVEQTQEQLAAVAHEEATIVKNHHITAVRCVFPEPQIAATLDTPKQFLKRNSLDGSYRPQLRQAQADTIATSRTRLTASLQEDNSAELLGTGISDEDLLEVIREYRGRSIEAVRAAIEEVNTILPKHELPPLSIQSLLLQAAGLDGQHTLGLLEDKEQTRDFNYALNRLWRALTDYASGPRFISNQAASYFEQEVKGYVRESLQPHYSAVLASEIEVLSDELTEAYERTTGKGLAYKPVAAKGKKSSPGKLNANPATSLEGKQREKMQHIGTLEDAFPWLSEGTHTDFYTVFDGKNTLIACKALPPAAIEISQRVRSKRLPTGNTFDNMWEQVQLMECANPYSVQGSGKINGITADHLKDLVITSYGNNSPNAKRIYYAKTNGKQFDNVADFLAAHGVNLDDILLILLGETDKANQLRTYYNFGVKRAIARSRNVGSI